jgi:hypothetical protein
MRRDNDRHKGYFNISLLTAASTVSEPSSLAIMAAALAGPLDAPRSPRHLRGS